MSSDNTYKKCCHWCITGHPANDGGLVCTYNKLRMMVASMFSTEAVLSMLPKTPFIIIPRHPVSPGLTNHNHNQRSISSRDPMLPSDWSDAFRCWGRRATELQNTASPRHKCVPRVLGRYLQTRASNEGSRIFTITKKVPTRAFSWLKAPITTITFKTLC